jgi:hypothetical protein
MEIVSGNMEDGCMGLKHSSQNLHVLMGICFEGLGYLSIETRVGLHVGGGFRSSSFEVHVSWRAISNQLKQVSHCQ